MTITKELNEDVLCIALEGRLDTMTAPELEEEIKENLADVKELKLDFTELEYISSAGLRVLLMAQKKMAAQDGSLKISGVNEMIREIFEVTGFNEILDIEE